MKRPDLPVYYYHDHFVEMLSFVRTTYRTILRDEHDAFVQRFQGSPKDAQCLLIRMVNRRGSIFNRTLFRYAEISDVERAADDLLACGQARRLKAEDYPSFAVCLPKDILLGGAKAAGRTDIRVSWPKAKLVDYFLNHVPFEVAAEHCGAADFIALDDVLPLEFLLYLYFGKTEVDLKNFALRDLGIVRTNQATSFGARFSDGDEARACFHYSRLLDRIEAKSPTIYRSSVNDILGGPDCSERLCRGSPKPRRLSGRSVLREARRNGSRQTALSHRVRRRNAASAWSVCITVKVTSSMPRIC